MEKVQLDLLNYILCSVLMFFKIWSNNINVLYYQDKRAAVDPILEDSFNYNRIILSTICFGTKETIHIRKTFNVLKIKAKGFHQKKK